MEYEFIPPSYLHPVVFGFYHLNRRAARAYFTWFLEQRSRRIELVEHAVRASPEAAYQAWPADGRVESLTVLGRWFAGHVHVRPRTAEEIEMAYADNPAWFRRVELDQWVLTDETVSFAVDLGMYFGQMLRRDVPGLAWQVLTNPKRSAYYHSPVLLQTQGTLAMIGSPLSLMLVFAYGLVDKTRQPRRLRELFAIWVAEMSPRYSQQSGVSSDVQGEGRDDQLQL